MSTQCKLQGTYRGDDKSTVRWWKDIGGYHVQIETKEHRFFWGFHPHSHVKAMTEACTHQWEEK